ncbi:amidohydrolase, partial [Klebsiella oxytoca]
MKCIDFRIRPLVDGYRAMVANKTTEKFLNAFRCSPPASVKEQSVELLLREMDEAGVDLAVVPGR